MAMVKLAEEAVEEIRRCFSPAGYGDRGYEAKIRNGTVVGYCAECGGEVKRVWSSVKAGKRETVCTRCGMVNPRLKRVELDDDEVVRCMKMAFEEISKRLGEQELDGNAWLRVVEYLLGCSIPKGLWRKKGRKWIEKAGLEVTVDGKVRKRLDG